MNYANVVTELTMSDLVIRKATPGDLEDILSFLRQEYDEQSTGSGFWCNRNLIAKGQTANELEVLAQGSNGKILAFCLWSSNQGNMDIIEVRPGYRHKGLGRYLTQHILDQLRARDFIGVEIQCTPEESLRVWQKMGFRRIEKEGCTGIYAVYVFRTTRHFPQDAKIKTIDIRLMNCGKMSEPPFSCQGMIESAECILQTDFATHFPQPVSSCGHVIEINLDGHLMYSDLVKYSVEVGVEVRGNFARCRALDISKVQSNTGC